MRFSGGRVLLASAIALSICCSGKINNVEEQSGKTFVVTEILYNTGVDTLEFIEIKNVSSTRLSLKGMTFSEGIEFKFADDAAIGKGQYIVLTNSRELFSKRYPSIEIAGVYTGKLSNSGDVIELIGSDFKKVFSVEYQPSGFWPSLADGLGYSIVTINESDPGDQNDHNDWIASANQFGSPGAADLAKAQSPVYVNEVLISSLTDRKDKIELYNPSSTQSIDISYYYLTDDRKLPKKFRIPSGTVIQPNSYTVFTSDNFKDYFAVTTGGGSIYLFGARSDSSYTGYSHGIDFDDASIGTSCGLIKNSDGKYFTSTLKSSTIGAKNSDAAMGSLVISEIMYHPADGISEFVEIINKSSDSILLYTQGLAWKVKGISFEFPGKVILKSNAICVLIDSTISPEAFRVKNSIDSSVQIFQYTGKLSNDSEMISIEMPGKIYYDELGVIQCPYITLDAVSYNDGSPWPKTADGDGYSLVRKDLTSWGNEPSNWRASDLKGGTPGKL